MSVPQIVIDTNVLVAGLQSRNGASFQLLSQIGRGLFDIHVSVPVVLEYEDVLRRNRRSLGLSVSQINDVLDYICSVAGRHEVFFLWRPALRDPNDDHILELAVTAQCSHIVTFNLRNFSGTVAFGITVVKPLELLRATGALP